MAVEPRVADRGGGLLLARPGLARRARLVLDHAEGTRRVYRVDPAGLQDLRAQLDRFWNTALANFKQLVEQPEEEA